MLRVGQAVQVTFCGVAADGGDVTISMHVRRVSPDGRAHLDAVTQRRTLNPAARRRQRITETVRHDVSDVQPGTVVLISGDASEPDRYTARLVRGYGSRASVMGLRRSGPP